MSNSITLKKITLKLNKLSLLDKVAIFKQLYSEIAGKGTCGDTELAHVNKYEVAVLKSLGGSGTVNELTQLRQYGGSSGPSTPSTTSQTAEIPAELKPYITDILGKSKAISDLRAKEGYKPYQGAQIAGFTGDQTSAFQGIRGLVGEGEKYFDPATRLTASAAQETTPGQVSSYMSPFMQNVVDIQQREARKQADITRQGIASDAVKVGGFGGSRQAILEGEQVKGLQGQLAEIQAKGLSAAYEDAQARIAAQRGRELAAGSQLAALGTAAPAEKARELASLQAVGQGYQSQEQQAIDIMKKQFEEESKFPEQQLQNYSSIVRGFPLPASTNSLTLTPQPGFAQQALGAAATGAGIYGAFGGFKNSAEGGRVGNDTDNKKDYKGLNGLVVKKGATGGTPAELEFMSNLEKERNLPKGLLNAVYGAESSFGTNPKAFKPNAKGALGHFQFMEPTAKQYGVTDRNDFYQSATGAADMFKDLLKQSGGDIPTALAMYNFGQGNIKKWNPEGGIGNLPQETKNYNNKVAMIMGGSDNRVGEPIVSDNRVTAPRNMPGLAEVIAAQDTAATSSRSIPQKEEETLQQLSGEVSDPVRVTSPRNMPGLAEAIAAQDTAATSSRSKPTAPTAAKARPNKYAVPLPQSVDAATTAKSDPNQRPLGASLADGDPAEEPNTGRRKDNKENEDLVSQILASQKDKEANALYRGLIDAGVAMAGADPNKPFLTKLTGAASKVIGPVQESKDEGVATKLKLEELAIKRAAANAKEGPKEFLDSTALKAIDNAAIRSLGYDAIYDEKSGNTLLKINGKDLDKNQQRQLGVQVSKISQLAVSLYMKGYSKTEAISKAVDQYSTPIPPLEEGANKAAPPTKANQPSSTVSLIPTIVRNN